MLKLNVIIYLMDSIIHPLTEAWSNSYCQEIDSFNTKEFFLQTCTASLPIGPSKPADGYCDGLPPWSEKECVRNVKMMQSQRLTCGLHLFICHKLHVHIPHYDNLAEKNISFLNSLISWLTGQWNAGIRVYLKWIPTHNTLCPPVR